MTRLLPLLYKYMYRILYKCVRVRRTRRAPVRHRDGGPESAFRSPPTMASLHYASFRRISSHARPFGSSGGACPAVSRGGTSLLTSSRSLGARRLEKFNRCTLSRVCGRHSLCTRLTSGAIWLRYSYAAGGTKAGTNEYCASGGGARSRPGTELPPLSLHAGRCWSDTESGPRVRR